jgi:hypothetical protein
MPSLSLTPLRSLASVVRVSNVVPLSSTTAGVIEAHRAIASNELVPHRRRRLAISSRNTTC